MFLTRGGRPRRSAWWRAWLARLLPAAGAEGAPMAVSASLAVSTEILTIVFDAPIDGEESTAVAEQFSVTDGVDAFAGVAFVDLVGAVLRVQLDLPGALPLEMTCAMAGGPGELRGIGGGSVAPFAGLAVTLG
jgi:hypothetical protein